MRCTSLLSTTCILAFGALVSRAASIPEMRREYYQLRVAACNSSDKAQDLVKQQLAKKQADFSNQLEVARTILKKDQQTAHGETREAIERDIATLGEEIARLAEIGGSPDPCAPYSYKVGASPADAPQARSLRVSDAKAELDSRLSLDNDPRLDSTKYNMERLREVRAWYSGLLKDAIDGLIHARQGKGRSDTGVKEAEQRINELKKLERDAGVADAQADTGEANDNGGGSPNPQPRPSPPKDFYPGRYVRILENNYKEKILLYDPRQDPKSQTTQLTAGADSELIIEVDSGSMGEEIALNRLVMSAKLLHGSAAGQNSKEQDIEIAGYSEIAKDPQTAASQNAVAFRTADTIQTTIMNMYYTTEDIIRTVYGDKCADQLAENPRSACYVPADIDPQLVLDRFRLYKPEIQAIAAFFSDAANAHMADVLGAQVFGVEPASLKAIASQYKTDLDSLLSSGLTDQTNAKARTDLLERTKLIWYDFHFLREEIANAQHMLEKDPSVCPEAKRTFVALGKVPLDTAEACWLKTTWKQKVRKVLKQMLVPGTISLGQYDPQDGDVVTLRVEAREFGGAVIGIPTIFKITLKFYDWKFRVSPSLLFIHREHTTHLTTDENGMPVKNAGAKPVNFAPAPGVTCAFTFHKRSTRSGRDGERRVQGSTWSSVMGFLSPGLGMNVSFMSFDQQDYDPAAGKFTKTQSSGVQVGAGVVGSLFGNKLQFVFGWNLNSAAPRSYIGVGFGFVELGKAIASVVKTP